MTYVLSADKSTVRILFSDEARHSCDEGHGCVPQRVGDSDEPNPEDTHVYHDSKLRRESQKTLEAQRFDGRMGLVGRLVGHGWHLLLCLRWRGGSHDRHGKSIVV